MHKCKKKQEHATVNTSIWGMKRNCPKCGSRFYDLNKNPATCPKCGHQFDPALLLVRSRRGRGAKKSLQEAELKALKAEAAEVKRKQDAKRKSVKAEDDIELEEFEDIDGMGDIEEIEEIDDMDDLEEIGELDEAEDGPVKEDDADDEAIIEGMEPDDESIVDVIEEESFDDEEDEDGKPASRRKKSGARAKPSSSKKTKR